MSAKELGFNAIVAATGTIVSAWLGGWDAALRALIGFMVLDYITGFLGAIKDHKVDSEVMFWGGIRKGIILVVIAVAVLLDKMVGNTEPILRTLAIYFYVSREGISVTENLGILGVYLPPGISRVLTQLQEKGRKTMEGIDCSTRLTSTSAQALKNAGISSIGRYLGYKQGWWKSLTPDEVGAIHGAGLSLFLIWESSPTKKDYFNYAKGVSDAKLAIVETEFLGVPYGVAIYFTVDYDAQAGDMVAISEYFRGVKDGLGGRYLLGVYGSYTVMQNIKVDRYFQTYAWSGGKKAPSHIYQYQNDVTIQGVAVDRDSVNSDAGLWGGNDVLEVAVLLNTKEDYWAGADVAVKNDNCAIFVRSTDKAVPADAMSAKKLIVIGGATTKHPNEVLLSGQTKYDTAAAVAKYLG